MDQTNITIAHHELLLYVHRNVVVYKIDTCPGSHFGAIETVVSKNYVPFHIFAIYKSS